MFPLVVLVGILWKRSSFLSPRSGSGQIRRKGWGYESAPALKKKDAAHTTAKFIPIIWMGTGALRGGEPDMEGA